MTYTVADSYKGYTWSEDKVRKNDKGKLVVDATCKCDRCVKGVFVTRVENGQPVPHPNYGGICLRCGGRGFLIKTIRVYTEDEKARMDKNNERTRAKKAEELERRMKADAAKKKAEWLTREGFNDSGETWIYIGSDSFDRKEELKELGFRFNSNLLWHISKEPVDVSPIVKLTVSDLAITFSAWGSGSYATNTRDIVNEYVNNVSPKSNSEWIGEEKEKITDYPVVLKSVRTIDTMYGTSQIVKFEDEDGNILVWFTKVDIDAEVGEDLLLSATVKTHSEYNGEKQTVVTRAKLR